MGTIIYPKKQCQYCNEIFLNVGGNAFDNHTRWCVKNPSRNDLQKKIITGRYGELVTENVMCQECGSTIVYTHRSKIDGKHPKYCSRKCANKRLHSETTKNKIAKSLCKNPLVVFNCEICGSAFSDRRPRKTCSLECRYERTRRLAESKRNSLEIKSKNQYSYMASFRFDVMDYPDEFDLSMVSSLGWYKPTNSIDGGNLNGVSLDHRLSVSHGFKHGILPRILAHPANSQLMIHTDNIIKNQKSSITLEELEKRIQIWDTKYGVKA